MKQMLVITMLVAGGLSFGPLQSFADETSAAKIKELTAKCQKGDQSACDELEFLKD